MAEQPKEEILKEQQPKEAHKEDCEDDDIEVCKDEKKKPKKRYPAPKKIRPPKQPEIIQVCDQQLQNQVYSLREELEALKLKVAKQKARSKQAEEAQKPKVLSLEEQKKEVLKAHEGLQPLLGPVQGMAKSLDLLYQQIQNKKQDNILDMIYKK